MAEKEHFVTMDYVRYIMALGVVVAHFSLVMNCDFWWPVSSGTAVSVFFGLSGFLVYATFQRKQSLKDFLLSRTKRIMPIYLVIVVASALLLSFVSTLSLSEYFCHPDLWKYLGANICFLNFLQPTLPGVFTDNVVPTVNGSLWTLKVEWALYLSIPLFDWAIRHWRISAKKLLFSIIVLSVAYKALMQYLYGATGHQIYHILSYQFIGQLTYFYSGVLVFLNFEYCKRHKRALLLLSAAMSIICWLTSDCVQHWAVSILYDLFYPTSIVTFFLLVSCVDWLPVRLPRIPNLSYELYLIHFPVIQVVAQEFHFRSNVLIVVLLAELSIMLLLSQVLTKATKSLLS